MNSCSEVNTWQSLGWLSPDDPTLQKNTIHSSYEKFCSSLEQESEGIGVIADPNAQVIGHSLENSIGSDEEKARLLGAIIRPNQELLDHVWQRTGLAEFDELNQESRDLDE